MKISTTNKHPHSVHSKTALAQDYQGFPGPKHFSSGYDIISITHTLCPSSKALSEFPIHIHWNPRNVQKPRQKSPKNAVSYTDFYRDPEKGITLLLGPIRHNPFIRPLPYSKLILNANGRSPDEIADLVISIFGTLDGAKVTYVEARVDILDLLSMEDIKKGLIVMYKRSYRDYKGKCQTIYIGSPRSHQIVAYDKGYQKYGSEDSTYIRIEARTRFSANQGPDLKDWLSSGLANPFGDLILANHKALNHFLTQQERAYLSRHGLHKLLTKAPNLSKARKRFIRKKIREIKVADLNAIFTRWARGWHSRFNRVPICAKQAG